MTGRERLAAASEAIMACPLPARNFIRTNKQRQTALVVAGHKPAGEIHLFGSDAHTQDAVRPIDGSERLEVEAWMARVGLKWRRVKDDVIDRGDVKPEWCHRIIYATALYEDILDRMQVLWSAGKYPRDQIEYGRLSGFPDTAIKAFDDHQCFKPLELPRELTDEPVMATVQFMFSKAYWRMELDTVRPWMDEIRDVLPSLYRELERLNDKVYRNPA